MLESRYFVLLSSPLLPPPSSQGSGATALDAASKRRGNRLRRRLRFTASRATLSATRCADRRPVCLPAIPVPESVAVALQPTLSGGAEPTIEFQDGELTTTTSSTVSKVSSSGFDVSVTNSDESSNAEGLSSTSLELEDSADNPSTARDSMLTDSDPTPPHLPSSQISDSVSRPRGPKKSQKITRKKRSPSIPTTPPAPAPAAATPTLSAVSVAPSASASTSASLYTARQRRYSKSRIQRILYKATRTHYI
uniref:Uncharacterized protein n=2 Tax=Lygus hesperus TaxID=30085 RepID=A0A146LSK7_LYGHE